MNVFLTADWLIVSQVVTWVLLVVVLIGMYSLFNYFGNAYISSRSSRLSQGPDAGQIVRTRLLRAEGGASVAVPAVGRPSILAFLSTNCDPCGELRPVLQEFAEAHSDLLVAFVHGDPADVSEWAAGLIEAGISVIADEDDEFRPSFEVDMTPVCIAVDQQGRAVAGSVVNSRGELDHLLRSAVRGTTETVAMEEVGT